ncbi:COG3904 family protein [Nitratireductor indicus]|uniref:COG3904 family protein n=1 Tax=Nitratireductor indicus TaxID=721133 RepID=UPI002876D13A|nr:hypothetical protein [Nitratireductor indicus]MDS1136787.1 hypothetical protein [Nitratireductor indicus]
MQTIEDTQAGQTDSPARRDNRQRFRWRGDATLIEAALVGALIGATVVLGMSLRDLVDRRGGLWPSEPTRPVAEIPVEKPAEQRRPSTASRPLRLVPGSGHAMKLSLEQGGKLIVSGTIEQGAAGRFRDELETRGRTIGTIVLDSPGGSLGDAMAMARLIRDRGLATQVKAGGTCASSCPLVLAGGVKRTVEVGASVSIHQFYATHAQETPAQAMADAQLVTARISRHLSTMGVDPALWLHALDTPPQRLYRLTGEELQAYRLTTRL